MCRSLEVDLTGQTSASYNMRLNYEKCLLEFEIYLSSGQYIADLAAGTAPSPDAITHQNSKLSLPPGLRVPALSTGEADIPAAVAPMTMTTRSSRDPRCAHILGLVLSLAVCLCCRSCMHAAHEAQLCCSCLRPIMTLSSMLLVPD